MNGILLGAFFFGSVFFIMPTALRFLSPMNTEGSFFQRIVYSLRLVDPRSNRYEGSQMIFQMTGILWILFGVGYKILVNTFSISGISDDLIVLFVLFGPGVFLFGSIRTLQSKYWEKQS